MNAEDLRIGNIVFQGEKYGEIPVTAYNIYQFKLFQMGAQTSEYYGDWMPVRLTEEKLLKFGFEEYTNGKEFRYPLEAPGEFLEIRISFDIFYFRLIYIEGALIKNQFPLSSKRYIHELQNLYFSITGQELPAL